MLRLALTQMQSIYRPFLRHKTSLKLMHIGKKIGTQTVSVNCKFLFKLMVFLPAKEMAEGRGFEPRRGVNLNTLSRRAP